MEWYVPSTVAALAGAYSCANAEVKERIYQMGVDNRRTEALSEAEKSKSNRVASRGAPAPVT